MSFNSPQRPEIILRGAASDFAPITPAGAGFLSNDYAAPVAVIRRGGTPSRSPQMPTSPEGDLKGPQRFRTPAVPSFDEVAQLIAGEEGVPAWLTRALERVAAGRLGFARKLEAEQPGRATARRQLQAVERASSLLLAVFGGPNMPVWGLLNGADAEALNGADLRQLVHTLTEIRGRAQHARETISQTGGRDLPWATASANPKDHCAMLVSEAWRLVRGARPRPGNRTAQEAASALWLASGGTETSTDGCYGATRHAGWRKHFHATEAYKREGELIGQLFDDFRRQPF
jgi:hypothetical protein